MRKKYSLKIDMKKRDRESVNFRRVNMKVAPPLGLNLISICCLVCLSNFVFPFASCLTSPSPPSSGVVSLYNSSADFVVSLDSSSIESVFQRDHAFILELYSSWCGHCIHFAPYYKAAAEFTRFWRHVIVVAAINCADSRNVETCRRFNVYGFPTLRLIPANAPTTHHGFDVSIRSVTNENMAHTLVEKMLGFISMHGEKDRPEHWPDFPPKLKDVYDDESAVKQKIASLMESVSLSNDTDYSESEEPKKQKEVVLVFENSTSKSFIAKTVALDLSAIKDNVSVFAVPFSEESREIVLDKENSNNETVSLSSLLELTSIPSIVFLSSPNVGQARMITYDEWESERESLVDVLDFDFIYDELDNNNNNSDTKGRGMRVGSSSPDDGGCRACLFNFIYTRYTMISHRRNFKWLSFESKVWYEKNVFQKLINVDGSSDTQFMKL